MNICLHVKHYNVCSAIKALDIVLALLLAVALGFCTVLIRVATRVAI